QGWRGLEAPTRKKRASRPRSHSRRVHDAGDRSHGARRAGPPSSDYRFENLEDGRGGAALRATPVAGQTCPTTPCQPGHGPCTRWRHRQAGRNGGRRGGHVLWTTVLILFALWLLGMVSSNTLGGFIHLLLLASIVVLVFRLLQRRSAF